MKKATMQTIVDYINDNAVEELFGVRDELNAELNKGAEEKARNAKQYEAVKDIVFAELANLGEGNATLAELYAAVETKLPQDFTKGKFQYAVTRLWKDELEKVEGKVNGYRLKV